MDDKALTIYCSSPGTFSLNRLGGWGRCQDEARTGSPHITPASFFGYKFSISRVFWYRKQRLHFFDMGPITPSPRLGRQKIKLTSISTGTEPCELFCAVVHRSSPAALTDSLWADHIRKPVMIYPRCVGSASQSFKNIFAMKAHSFIYSGIKTFKTSFEHAFFISKFCRRILCSLVYEISVLSAISLIVFRRAYLTSRFFFSTLCALYSVAGRPAQASSSTDSLSLRQWPAHFFTAVLFNTCVPNSLVCSFLVSVSVWFFCTRNLITECCSVCSRSSLIV